MAGLFGLLLAVDLLVVGPALALLWAQVLVKSAPAPWHLVVAGVALVVVPWLLAWRLTRGLKRARVIPAGRRLLALLACGLLHAGALLGWMRLERVETAELMDHLPAVVDQAKALARGELDTPTTPPPPSTPPALTAVGVADGGVTGREGKPPEVVPPAPVDQAASPDGGSAQMEWTNDDVNRALLTKGFGYPPRPRRHAPTAAPTAACPKGAHQVKGVQAGDGGAWVYCTLPNGFMHGQSVQWHANGALKEVGQFKNGLKQGTFERYDAEGNLLLRGAFDQDLKTGAFEEWWDVELPGSDENALPRAHGMAEGTYVKGSKQGSWTGVLERCFPQPPDLLCVHVKQVQQFKAGVPDGRVEEWFENGQQALLGTYRAGRPHGPWTYHHADGTLSWRQSFQNGHRSGTWQQYCPNGRLVRREQYDAQGRRHGAYDSWNSDGSVFQRGRFFEGRLDDRWETHFGDITEEALYSRGVATRGKTTLHNPRCQPADKTALALRHRVSSAAD